jgi:hypothetical protein
VEPMSCGSEITRQSTFQRFRAIQRFLMWRVWFSSWTLRSVELACRSWLHWVPSKFNIADPLSRPTVLGLSDDFSLLGLGFPLLRVVFVFLSSFSWREF